MNEEDYSLLEPEHVEQVLQGAVDTVEGLENHLPAPTRAQAYLYSTLEVSGLLSRKDRVMGVEGFVSAIGDGLKAMWEYIKKIFKGIFGVFFKKEAKEELDDTKDKLEKAEVAIEKQGSTTTFKAGSFKASVKRQDGSPATKKILKDIDNFQKQIQEGGTVPEAKVQELAKEIFEANLVDSEKLKANGQRLKEALQDLEDAKNKYNAVGDEAAISVQVFLNGLIGLPELANKIHDLKSAKDFIFKSGRCLEAMKNNFESLKSHESALKKKIDRLESNNAVNDNAVAVKGEMESLKKELSQMTRVCKLGVTVMASIRNIADAIKAACVTG